MPSVSPVSCYVGFSHFLGIGPVRFEKLLCSFGDVASAYTASPYDLRCVLGEMTDRFVAFRKTFDSEKQTEEIHKKGIQIITRQDSRFPQSLRSLPDAPICLYVKGHLDGSFLSVGRFFSIVGTRKPTSYGVHVARMFARELTQVGFSIVSGLALGIDAVSHAACIEQEGRTVAFLGCGVDIVYPLENEALYRNIIASGGLVISEFPPGMTVLKGLFIARNRLISGLSEGVLVVEGAKDSGSLVTARYAADQGKEVFAPPVPITSPLAEAPLSLLKQGATIVTCSQDITDVLKAPARAAFQVKGLPPHMEGSDRLVYELLIKEELHADEIGRALGLPVHEVLCSLSRLEMLRVIEKLEDGRYGIKRM